MGRPKRETYYVIDETDDELMYTEAASAQEAVEHFFAPLNEEDGTFHVTVFRARDARRFKLQPDVEVRTIIEEVK